ncbi:MAG: response regulator [Bacteroidales bacterium]|nr:response regulator [Bacteroidales bacterium]
MTINCIAIDDEPLALDKMKEYIKRIGYLNHIGSFDNALDALSFLKNNQVDLIFLDIQMDELSGIQMLEALNIKPKVVLTTAYDQYALKGYELDVCDYLLKPIAFQRFLQACEKIYDLLFPLKKADISVPSPSSKESSKDFFFVKNGSITQNINFHEILYVEGMKDYLRICTSKEKIMTLISFKKLEEALPKTGFMRIHKSYLIQLDKIESIERNRVMITGERIPIGDSYKKAFFSVIEDWKMN